MARRRDRGKRAPPDTNTVVMPATGSRLRRARWQAPAGIQYAAASRLHRRRWWNTGSPAFAGDDKHKVDLLAAVTRRW